MTFERSGFVVIGAGVALGACLMRQDLGSDPPVVTDPTAPTGTETGGQAGPGSAGNPGSSASDGGNSVDASVDGSSEAGALSAEAAAAFDPASCKPAPIGFAGLASIIRTPIPYRVFGRFRDCRGDACTAWQALPDDAELQQASWTTTFRRAARTGRLVAGEFNTFKLVSDETCPGSSGFYGCEQGEIQDGTQAVCGYYYAPQGGDAGSHVCDQAIALSLFAGTSSPTCIQMAGGWLEQLTGRQYQLALLVRF